MLAPVTRVPFTHRGGTIVTDANLAVVRVRDEYSLVRDALALVVPALVEGVRPRGGQARLAWIRSMDAWEFTTVGVRHHSITV